MKQGPLNKQLHQARQVLEDLREKCLALAGEVVGYQGDIERIASSDIDLDTAAIAVGALKDKIGILEKREAQTGKLYSGQREKVEALEKELESAVQGAITETAALSVADLDAALAKLLPKFQHLKTAQRLAGNSMRWSDRIHPFIMVGFSSLNPVLSPDEGAVTELLGQIRDAV